MSDLATDLAAVCNKYAIDDLTETPDFILGNLLVGFINAYGTATLRNINWHKSWKTLDETLNAKA